MATIEKHKAGIIIYASYLPKIITIFHDSPDKSHGLIDQQDIEINSDIIKKYIEEAESLAKCLRRGLIAQKTAENKLKPKVRNPYAKRNNL